MVSSHRAVAVAWARIMKPHEAAFGSTPILGLAGLGSIGAWTLSYTWIGIIIGHYSGLEPFEWPYGVGLRNLLINCVLDLILNLSLLVGSLLTSPVFMAGTCDV